MTIYLVAKQVYKYDVLYNPSIVLAHFDNYKKAYRYMKGIISFHYRKSKNIIENTDYVFQYQLNEDTVICLRILELGDKDLK